MDKTRIVLVGCGGVSQAWVRAIRDHYSEIAEIVGFVDLFEESARGRATQYGVSSAWVGTDLAAAIKALKPDVVFNATIPSAHFSLTKMALEAGCNVLVEKPFAESVSQASELVDVAARCDRLLAVLQNRRCHGDIQKVARVIRSGAIGQVNTLNVDFYMAPHFAGFREDMAHLLLLDMSIHTFDQARFMSGENPKSVYCYEYNPVGSWNRHGSAVMAIFEMSGGVVFNYRGSWVADGADTSWYGAWRIVGDRGTLLWDGEGDIRVGSIDLAEPPREGRERSRIVQSTYTSRTLLPAEVEHPGVIGDFLKCVRNGGTPVAVGSDNVHSLAMVEKAILSAESGQRVPF